MSKSQPSDLAVPKAVSIKKDLYLKATKQAESLNLSFSQYVCILLRKELKNKEGLIISPNDNDIDLSKF